MSYLFLKKNVFLLIFCTILGFVIFINNSLRYNFGVLITSFIISSFSLYRMFKLNGRPYSLNKIFYIFTFFFLGLAPALQFKNDRSFWGVGTISVEDYLLTNIIIIAAVIVYDFCYQYFLSKPLIQIKQFKNFKLRQPINRKNALWILIIISFCSSFLFFYSRGFNLLAIVVRGGIVNESSLELSGPLALIFSIFIRPLPVVALVLYRLFYRRFDLWEIILITIVLLSNAPTGMPRFQAAALYIPLLLLYVKPVAKNINFSLVLSGALLVIFPLLDIFRNFTYYSTNTNIYEKIFLSPDFDSYQNLLLVVKHELITYGEQLLGVLLFFIPRSLWESKPVGSGWYMSEELGLSFHNISMNYFGEGYINFGFIGVFLFAVCLAYLNNIIDKKYWHGKKYLFINSIYLFLLGMEFFILRGDLLSSFAYTVGLITAIYLVFKLTTKKVR